MTVSEPGPPPPVIATIGMHASASTWIFNVVRELVAASAGPDAVSSLYADMPEAPARLAECQGAHLIVKSHQGSVELDDWLRQKAALVFLSIRDPRDACLSMAIRFKTPLRQTARWIADDCARLLRLAAQNHPVYRYEDRFFEDRATMTRLGAQLRIETGTAIAEAIFARYRIGSVRAFAQSLASLPPGRVSTVGEFSKDETTQIWGTHIGDARSGKWRALPNEVQVRLTRLYAPFLAQFGYGNDDATAGGMVGATGIEPVTLRV